MHFLQPQDDSDTWMLLEMLRLRAARDEHMRHFMQVSKWLGHSIVTLTLSTYGDRIAEQDGGAANTLPQPPGTLRATQDIEIVPLFRQQVI